MSVNHVLICKTLGLKRTVLSVTRAWNEQYWKCKLYSRYRLVTATNCSFPYKVVLQIATGQQVLYRMHVVRLTDAVEQLSSGAVLQKQINGRSLLPMAKKPHDVRVVEDLANTSKCSGTCMGRILIKQVKPTWFDLKNEKIKHLNPWKIRKAVAELLFNGSWYSTQHKRGKRTELLIHRDRF